MSPLDVIELPGQPGKYGRRALVDAWQAAGSPPVNGGGAGRLYGLQKHFWDGWAQRLPGFNPADNPDDESQRLAHVRFGALDIDPTPERVRRLEAAGLIRPYSYEPWHWELPNIRRYSIVRALPARPTAPQTKPQEVDHMTMLPTRIDKVHKCLIGPGMFRHMIDQDDPDHVMRVLSGEDRWNEITLADLPEWLRHFGCDLNIWRHEGGALKVLDPLTGTVKPGNVWTSTAQARAESRTGFAHVLEANDETVAYLHKIATA